MPAVFRPVPPPLQRKGSVATEFAGGQTYLRSLAAQVVLTGSFQGYAYWAPITVTGGDTAVSGSVSVPTASGQDYVVQLHLVDGTAASVWSGIVDQAAFGDVSVWWTNGSLWTQLDVDIDQQSNGPWSSSNITLWFKLQAALGASPATDSTYVLAWGNPAPTVKNTWANIYPFSDDFPGSALSAAWSTDGSLSVAVSGGVLTLSQPSASTFGAIYTTTPRWAGSYALSMYGSLNPTGSGAITELSFKNTDGSPTAFSAAQLYATTGQPAYWVQEKNAAGTVIGFTTFGSVSTANRVYTIARSATGGAYGFADATTSGLVAGTNLVAALPAALALWQQGTITLDWIKVRPWTASEPTCALGTIAATSPLSKRPIKALAAQVAAAIIFSKMARKALSASCTATAALSKRTARALAATLQGVAVLAKTVGKALSASLVATIVVSKRTARALGASCAAAAGVVKQTQRTLSASVSLSAVLNAVRIVLQLLNASLLATATISKRTGKALAAAGTVTADLSKEAAKALSATLVATAQLVKRTSRALTATLSALGALSKQTSRALAATVPASAQATKTVLRTLSASSALSAVLDAMRMIMQLLQASITLSATTSRSTARTLMSSVAATVDMVKTTVRTLLSDVTASATLAMMSVRMRTLVASLDLSASLSRSTRKMLISSCTATVALVRSTLHGLSSSLVAQADMVKTTARTLVSSLPLSALLMKSRAMMFSASVAAVGLLHRTAGKLLVASLTATATTVRARVLTLAATLVVSAQSSVMIGKALAATAACTVALNRMAARALSVSLVLSASVAKQTRRLLDAALAGLSATLDARRILAQTLAASLQASTDMTRSIMHRIAALLSVQPLLNRQTARTQSATLATLATVRKMTERTVDVTVDAAAALQRQGVVALAATIAATTLLRRTISRHIAATQPLSGPTYVAFLRPAVRYVTVLRRRLWDLILEKVRPHQLFAHAVRPVQLTYPARVHLLERRGKMRLVPADAPGTSLTIAPTESNLSFTADFSEDIPAGAAIASYQVSASILGPGTDVSGTFIALSSYTATTVTVVVGNGNQTRELIYRVLIDATLNNSPPTVLAGFFDIPCLD